MRAAQQAVRDAEHRFPVRIRIVVPAEGLGNWLDQDLNPIQHARRRQRCVGHLVRRYNARDNIHGPLVRRTEGVDGVYLVRNHEPMPRVGAALCTHPWYPARRATVDPQRPVVTPDGFGC